MRCRCWIITGDVDRNFLKTTHAVAAAKIEECATEYPNCSPCGSRLFQEWLPSEARLYASPTNTGSLRWFVKLCCGGFLSSCALNTQASVCRTERLAHSSVK